MRSGWRWLAVLLFVALMSRSPKHSAPATLTARLLGPCASLAASAQWVRVGAAIDEGRHGLAYTRANLALDLDPEASAAWSFLASHYAHDRAAILAEPNPALRTSWVRTALALLERGEEVASKPAQLALHRGLILVHVGDLEGTVPWPGQKKGAWLDAERAFEDAIEHDRGATEAWVQLARHRVLRLAAPAFEPEPAQRVAALEAAVFLLHRGSAHARRPGRLDFERGLLLGISADGADGALWPGGRRALLDEACEAFLAAASHGTRGALGAAASAREALEGSDLEKADFEDASVGDGDE